MHALVPKTLKKARQWLPVEETKSIVTGQGCAGWWGSGTAISSVI